MLLLNKYIAANGFVISTRVSRQGSPEIWFQNANLSQTTAFEFSARTNDIGDTAWATVFGGSPKDSLSRNEVYFNGRIVAQNVAVQDLALSDTHLGWISPGTNGTTITFFDLLSEKMITQRVDFVADKIRAIGNQFVLSGLYTASGDTASAILAAHAPPVVMDHGNQVLQLSGAHSAPMLIETSGSPAALALFNAMMMISEYAEEALAIATDDTGRVTNMFVPRLEALTALAQVTGDPELQERAAKSALDAIREASPDGIFFSTRYSLGEIPMAWSMHAALINGAALGAIEWMTVSERAEVISVARAAFDYFETDWVDNAYVITPRSGVDFDGVIQPNNMQAAMGIFAVQLFEATGEQRYLDRANAVLSLLSSELVEYQSVNVFNYWPKAFRDGWSEGTFDSASRPTYPPTQTALYDDVYHAGLVISFFELIARIRNEIPLVDSTALFELVQVGSYEFKGYLNGGPTGLEWLPPWSSASQFALLATKPFPTTLPVYDEGVHIAAVARVAASLLSSSVGPLSVILRHPVSGEITDTISLIDASSIVNWVQAFESNYALAEEPANIIFGTDVSETLSGTAGAETIRGLDGNDSVALGDGADSGFGDMGNDRIDGEEGPDTLAGGYGDDDLFGGNGNDRLFGQNGTDRLFGGNGDDLLSGGEDEDGLWGCDGNDILYGGSGTDRLYGGEGNDLLDAGGGVAGDFQYLFGEGGDDTYVYGTASGLVYIGSSAESAVSGTADRVVFSDLNISDIRLGYQDYRTDYPSEGLALMIMWTKGQQSGQLQIANSANHIEAFEFANGQQFNTLQSVSDAGGSYFSVASGPSADLIFGGSGTDRLYGGEGTDLLDAGGGVAGDFQYLFGEGGDDTYVYGTASGLVYIGSSAESAVSGTADRVVFSDLNISDIRLGYQDYRTDYPSEGLALMIMWTKGQQSGQLQIANSANHIEAFEFANGQQFNTLQSVSDAGGSYFSVASGPSADLIFGGSGTDRLYGGEGNDLLDAGGGVAGDFQYLFGEGGDDTYVYGTASGLVYIGSSAESAVSGTADRVVFSDLNISDIRLGYQDYRTDYPSEGLALMIMWTKGQQSGQLQIANSANHIEAFEFANGDVFSVEQLLAYHNSKPQLTTASILASTEELAPIETVWKTMECTDAFHLTREVTIHDANASIISLMIQNMNVFGASSATNPNFHRENCYPLLNYFVS